MVLMIWRNILYTIAIFVGQSIEIDISNEPDISSLIMKAKQNLLTNTQNCISNKICYIQWIDKLPIEVETDFHLICISSMEDFHTDLYAIQIEKEIKFQISACSSSFPTMQYLVCIYNWVNSIYPTSIIFSEDCKLFVTQTRIRINDEI